MRLNGAYISLFIGHFLFTFADFPALFRSQFVLLSMFLITCGALTSFKTTHYQAADHQGGEAPRGPAVLQHLEMAMSVTELTPQQLSYFEYESAHTLILRSMHVLKD